MLRRLLHSTALFVAIVVAYEAYVLAMVPWIEPTLAVWTSPSMGPEKITNGGASVRKYQHVLAAYFPRDHWSQTRPPKVMVIDNLAPILGLAPEAVSIKAPTTEKMFALLIFP